MCAMELQDIYYNKAEYVETVIEYLMVWLVPNL
jgi:hypothetical protein